MLNGTLSLHDIDDVEIYCARIIHRVAPGLDQQDLEDLLAYLIATTWELSLKHDPTQGGFTKWAGRKLAQRITDWRRQRYGRTTWHINGRVYQRTLPQVDSLEQHAMARAHTASTMDAQAHSLSDLTRLLRARARGEHGPPHPLGHSQTDVAA